MRILRTIGEVHAVLREPRRNGRTIGLVPTMGAFHGGHLALMGRAREQCDVVVVSLFVNPSQFDDKRDLGAYPRDEARDATLAERAGVDYLFAPATEEMYPGGFATKVSVVGLTEVLEGAWRGRQHFDAVTTVVAKLFNIVAPTVAYFGQKDAQQALVIRRMVRDLDLPVRIAVVPTVREPDGVAMSSRNVLLSPADRVRASALHRALDAIRQAVTAGEHDPEAARARALKELALEGLVPEYLELVSPDTLTPLTRIDGGPVLAVLAARFGRARLIDNELIQPVANTAGNDDNPLSTAHQAVGSDRPLSTAHAAGSANDGRP